jgi:hypothetical protein
LNLRSLLAVAAITAVAMMSVVQAADQPGRKIVHQPEFVTGEMTRGSQSADQIEHHIAKIDGTRFHYRFWQSTPG